MKKKNQNNLKNIFFITFGCKLNQAETDDLKNKAVCAGFKIAEKIDDADIVIINSCVVTKRASSQNHQTLVRLKKLYPGKKLILTGCDEGTDNQKLAELIPKETLEKFFNLNNNITQKPEVNPRSKTRGLVKIQDGCNNFCSYCIVPYVRGREKSISIGNIIKRIKMLEENGCQEIVLVGVNIGRYKKGSVNLTALLKLIVEKTDINRIRLTSIHPEDISLELIDLMMVEKRICNHIHLSLQSGSNKVLKDMNRRYTAKEIVDLVKLVREKVKDVTFTTDIIIGFPGETEDDFLQTLALIKKVKFLKVHLFRFSLRPGTAAAKFQNQVPESIKKERYLQAANICTGIRIKILKSFLGRKLDILFEANQKGSSSGFSSNYLKVKVFGGKSLKNKIIRVELEKIVDDYFVN